MKKWIYKSLLVTLLLPLQAMAEDIDLFVNPPPVQESGPANVLLILDSTANWNTAFENEMTALRNVFFGLDDPNDWNVGLMMFGDSPNLGYVRAAIRNMATPVDYDFDGDGVPDPMWDIPDDGKDFPVPVTANYLYGAMIQNFDKSTGTGDGANARTLARTFAEAYRYLTGQNSVDTSSNTGVGKNSRRDYEGNSVGEEFSDLVFTLDSTDPDIEPHALDDARDVSYNGPPENGLCGNTYIIYIGNNVSSGNVTKDNNARNQAAKGDLETAARAFGVDPTEATRQITDGYIYTSHQDNYADEWARLMHDQMDITFYAIDVNPTDYPGGNINGMGNSDLLRSFSQGVGGGEYYRVYSEGDQIEIKLKEIFSQIQAKNTVFASVALPASTTGNSIFLNQVFIGLFRPDANGYPLWPGNLKQYQLGLTTANDLTSVRLFDAKPTPELAIDSSVGGTGFIKECAQSFWTSGASDGYWSFDPQGTCTPYTETNPSPNNSPDGPYVEKGAQGYMMRGMSQPLNRNVKTCRYDLSDCNSTGLENFSTGNGNITQAMMDTSPATDSKHQTKNDLIQWALGRDLEDDNTDTDMDETRAYVHADVIHSRPVALNYGDDDNPQVVVYFGSNDGMLKAINGNQTGTVAGAAPGEEIWAFMPPEFYDQIKYLKLNENGEAIKFPATGSGSIGKTGIPKPYGVDGSIVAFEGDIEDASLGGLQQNRKHIYAGMRRGGRAIYGFDVTDPATPVLLWKIGCDDSECTVDSGSFTGDWTDIGQTWAPVSVAFLEGRTNPILLISGGYDPCEDTDIAGGANNSCSGGTTGDHIYVVDAYTGDMLAQLPTERSVPGGVTVVTVAEPTMVNPNPAIQFAYAADTGGNIYRISGPLAAPADIMNPDVPTAITAAGTSAAPDTWEIQRIADFGCGNDATDVCNASDPNRKFLFPPDVVRVPRDSDNFRVLGVTGDREKPLISYVSTTGVQNYFVSFVDQPLTEAWPDTGAFNVTSACGEAVVCLDALFPVTRATPTTLNRISDSDLTNYPVGFSVALTAEEQGVTGTLVVGDEANFSTHIPYRFDPNDVPENPTQEDRDRICVSGLGQATTYNVDFQDAEGDLIDIYTGGLVPTPVAGEVLICENGDCVPVPFCIGCGGENSPIGGGSVNTGTSFERSKGRVFWNIEH